jgi:uronate dehydrogenase
VNIALVVSHRSSYDCGGALCACLVSSFNCNPLQCLDIRETPAVGRLDCTRPFNDDPFCCTTTYNATGAPSAPRVVPVHLPSPAMPVAPTPLRFSRLLLTGAAGGLGRELRSRLKACCDTLRLSDIADLGSAAAGEELRPARLEDRAAMLSLVEGVDAVVHLGGVSTEQPYDLILQANIVGTFNLYEAARKHGVKRIVFASSNHVTGFYRQDEVIGTDAAVRADGHYGLSKAYGENLSRYYFDRFGIETVCIRIGSSFPEPKDRRMLATWLSYDDLERLVVAALTAPVVGHSIVYGMSDNSTTWWDNTSAKHLGWKPQDSSEPFRAKVEARQTSIDFNDPAALYQGGAFVRTGPFD